MKRFVYILIWMFCLITCQTIDYAKSITINSSANSTLMIDAKPEGDFTFTPDSACSGTEIKFDATVSKGTSPYTYSWRFGDGGTSSLQNTSHVFNLTGCGIATLSDTLIITDADNFSDTVIYPIHILRVPDVQLKDENVFSSPPFSNCLNEPTPANPNFTLKVNNISPSKNCIDTYSIDWGDNTSRTGLTAADFPLSHLYTQLGAFNLVITAKGSNGCSNSRSYPVINQTIPAVGIEGPGGTGGCAPIGFWFKLRKYESNSPGTYYVWNFGDNTPPVPWYPPITTDSIFHVFNSSSCGQPGNQFTVKVTAKNGCDSTSATVNNIRIYTKPVANFLASASACINQTVTFTNTSTAAYNQGSCSRVTSYSWNFGDTASMQNTSAASSPSHLFSAAGIYKVTLIANGSCGNDTISKTICITPVPTPRFSVADTTGCVPFTVKVTNTSDTSICPPTKYKWTVSYSPGSCGTSSSFAYAPGSTDSSTNATFVFNNAGTYIIRLAIASPCGNAPYTKTITVKKKPTLSLPADTTSCGPVAFTPRAVIPVCETGLLKYAWSFSGGEPDTSNNLNPGNITFTDTGLHMISLKVTNGCGHTTVYRKLTISPPPNVIVPNDTSYCAGRPSGSFTFFSSVTGVTYPWTNSTTSIGLSASGTGNINSFITANSTVLPVVATIKVRASKAGCLSPIDSFKITVNPRPPVLSVTTPVIYCLNDAAVPLTARVDTGNTLIWYNSPADVIGSTTAPTPSTTGLPPVNYYVSQKSIATGCESNRSTIVVNTRPVPIISSGLAANPKSCASSDGTITLSGLSPNISYTVRYTKNGVPSVPVALSSNSAGAIVIAGLTAGIYTNISVLLNGCPSNTAGPFTLLDPNPPATPDANTNAPLCSGGTLNLTATSLAGVTYFWTGPNGFTSAIQNPVIANVTTAANGTYYLTVNLNGCTSLPDSAVVLIKTTPAAPTAQSNSPLCSDSTLMLRSATTSIGNTLYSWTGPNGFTSSLQNPTITNVSATGNGVYSVTATSAEGSCRSLPGITNVIIKPTPKIAISSFTDPRGCASSNGQITINGLVPNTTYLIKYTRNRVAVPPAPALSNAAGNIVLSGLAAGTYTGISVMLNDCPSNELGPVVLQESPSFKPIAGSNSPVCAQSDLKLTSGPTLAGSATYLWTGPGGFTSLLQNPVIVAVDVANSGIYKLTVTINGCSAEDSVLITVSPKPTGGNTNADASVCSGTNNGTIILTGNSGQIKRWESSVNNGILWNTINNTTSSLTYNNLFTTTWYRAVIQNGACIDVYSDTTRITVISAIALSTIPPKSIITCNQDTTITFNALIPNAGNIPLSYKWFINNQVQGISNPFTYRFRAPLNSPTTSDFNIKVLVENAIGCGDSLVIAKVSINPSPLASIKVSPSLVQYQPQNTFTFQDISTANPNKVYAWTMGDRLSQTRTGREITHEYGDAGTYKVRLRVTDYTSGCIATDSAVVVILSRPGSLYVPNAFYPNSKKNELTTFRLTGIGLEKFHLQVFDAWNKLVFETTELTPDGSPKIAWNGRYFNNGKTLQQDAYVWKIVEAKFKNGQDWEGMSYNGSIPKRFGTVTLFR